MTTDQKINAINALNGTITAFALTGKYPIATGEVVSKIMAIVKTIDEPERLRITPKMLERNTSNDNIITNK